VGDRIKTADLARGRWPYILSALGVPPKILNGRHQPCLFCGGNDRARFTNWKDEGYYFCNQCGSLNGFEFLMKFKGIQFSEAAKQVDELIAGNWRISIHPSNAPKEIEIRIPKSVKDCALWLRKYRPADLEPWLERHDVEVRWWLDTQEFLG
jgi:phage/plasmid primase-like uncharacterized protein